MIQGKKEKSTVLLFRNIFYSPGKEENEWFSQSTWYLASALRKAGINIVFSSFKFSDNKEEVKRGFKELEDILKRKTYINFIGISLCEDFFIRAKKLITFLRKRTDAFIGVGCVMPTLSPTPVFRHLSGINFLVRGAGEDIFPRLVRILRGKNIHSRLDDHIKDKLSGLRGLAFRHKSRTLVSSLDTVNQVSDYDNSILDFSLLKKENLSEGLNLYTSRGCFNNCFFCTTPGKGRYQAKSFKNLKEILQNYHKRLKEIYGREIPSKAYKISFNDDDFLADPDRVVRFFHYLKNTPFRINFFQTGINSFFLRKNGRYTNMINKKLVDSLSSSLFSGSKRDIYIGTENFCDDELDRLGKGYDYARIEKVIKILTRKRIFGVHHLILSNHLTMPENILDNLIKINYFRKCYGKYFQILIPIIPYLVSLYPSASYRMAVLKKRTEYLNIKRVLSIKGHPEYDYPLVINDIPMDRITRNMVPMITKLFSREKDYFMIMERALTYLLIMSEKIPSLRQRIVRLVEHLKGHSSATVIEEKIRSTVQSFMLDFNSRKLDILDRLLFDLLLKKEMMLLADIKSPDITGLEKILSRYSRYHDLILKMALTNDYLDKKNLVTRIYQAPTRLILLITHACQLKCRYCRVRKFSSSMDEKVMRKAVELLFTSNRRDIQLQFFGGEPLLRFDLVKKAVEYAQYLNNEHKRELTFILSTNGLALTKEKVDFFKRYNFLIEFSLDGEVENQLKMRRSRDNKNYYSQLKKNLEYFLKSGIPHYSISVVMPQNVSGLFEVFQHLFKLGFKKMQINYSLGNFWPEKAIHTLFHETERIIKYVKRKKGIEFVNLSSIRREPVVLNSELTVDCDGGIYLESGICLEEDFMAMKKRFLVSDITKARDINLLASTHFQNFYRLSKIYGEASPKFRKIILNNIFLGQRYNALMRKEWTSRSH
ncbi:MAG: radical SAM protein [Spirochaetes bacterium]|nr:radical SAM protein [Spirochaetota bacterium]